jgi:hypothetical protein
LVGAADRGRPLVYYLVAAEVDAVVELGAIFDVDVAGFFAAAGEGNGDFVAAVGRVRMAGVLSGCSTPSTRIWAPGGLELTATVPVRGEG